MKTLIIYYSLTGNTKFIAENMAYGTDADVLELKTKETVNPFGFRKFIWAGKQILMRKLPELLPLAKNPNDYDLIVIGTPVWAWTFSPAIQSFFNMVNFKNKKVALFSCHGGGKGRVFEKMKLALPNNTFVGEIDFFEPLNRNAEEKKQQAIAWIKDLLK
jgi:flavodoxin